MLSKGSGPMMIGKISELLLSGGSRGGFMEAATSPRSPLEMNVQSPRGMKSYDVSGGVGLGIVAALVNNHNYGCEVLEKYAISYSRSSSSSSSSARSCPIPVGYDGVKKLEQSCCDDELEMDSLEDYTFVTCRRPGPNKQSFTRVFCTKGEIFGKEIERSKKSSIFSVSPGRFGEEFSEIPREDFLSSCNLCKKKLHGKDVYMYRGEMAFCSEECRQKQIMMDEGKELWRSEASRSFEDVSSSTCTRDYMFSPSILAI